MEASNGAGRASRKGSSGTAPQRTKAANVLSAAVIGERGTSDRPYSSLSIVSTHWSSSAVITRTARSRSFPSNPFAA
jgi:hypothetical protein